MKRIAILLAVLLLLSACGIETAPEASAAASTTESFGTEAPAGTETAQVTAEETTAEEPAAEPAEPAAEAEPEAGSEQEAETEPAETAEETAQNPVIVVYFSRMGNTDFPEDVDAVSSASLVDSNGELKGNAQLLAEWMADEAGCETWEITTSEKYPADYDETTDVAKEEQNEDARPALSAQLEGFDGIETVYLVYPNWWGDLPMALYSFFDEYDFAGKTICVSVTHGGSGFSGGISTIQTLEPDAQVVEGLSLRDSSVPDAEEEARQLVRDTNG